MKSYALIRSRFHLDPKTLDEEAWARLTEEAFWLVKFEAELTAEEIRKVIVKLFGKK